MKNMIKIALVSLLGLLLFWTCGCYAQAGVGTLTPEPYSMLTIANPNGVSSPLVVKGMSQRTDLDQVVVYDPITGEQGYRMMPTGTGGLITSIQNISEWRANPLDITATGAYLDDNIDLNLLRAVSVPPFTTAIISIRYSVPIELLSSTGQAKTGAGVYLTKDGVKMPYSEVSMSLRNEGDHGVVQLLFPDWITNPNGVNMAVTYEIKGYLNQESNSGTGTYRFRRHDADINLNKNRGTQQMHIRILNAQ